MTKLIKPSLLVSLLMVVASAGAVAPAQVPVTGETGGVVGSENGVAWPSPRFVVAGDGAKSACIIDKLTGLMWSKNGIIGFTKLGVLAPMPDLNSNIAPDNLLKWSDVFTAITNLNTETLCGYSDWRLPNKVELRSLVNYGQAASSTWLNLPAQGFSTVAGDGYYWSSTTDATNTPNAFAVRFDSNITGARPKVGKNYVWPVRGGQ